VLQARRLPLLALTTRYCSNLFYRFQFNEGDIARAGNLFAKKGEGNKIINAANIAFSYQVTEHNLELLLQIPLENWGFSVALIG
jgi:hypothetical protein